MKRGSFVSNFKENEIFLNLEDPQKNRDGYFCDLWVLRNRLLEAGVDLSTSDLNPPDISNFIIQETINKESDFGGKVTYLLLMESDIIRPGDFNPERHANFTKVFTWSDRLVESDPRKYIKRNYSFCFPSVLNFTEKPREKLCTMIAGNKISYAPTELYSNRLEAIKWFEENRPEDFDLYGIAWNRLYIKSRYKLMRIPNSFKSLDRILYSRRPSFRGAVKTKKEILSQYRFSICYENCASLGYISEKIFDCFFAGCVPIYLGAPNIASYIPHQAFIDRSNFKSNSDLYKYISEMSQIEYDMYQNAIIDFLKSQEAQQFNAKYNAEIFLRQLIDDGIII